MKNLTLFLVLISTFSYSQIKKIKTEKSEIIGKIGAIGQTWIECSKSGEKYTFLYKDMKFKQIDEFKSFSFDDIDNAFDELYNIIINGLENKPEEDIMLELPDDVIYLHFEKSMGITSVSFWHYINSNPEVIGVSTWMNKKKAAKLFGKRK